MKFALGTRRSTLTAALFWAAGVAAVWWLMPEGPRDGWQPPRDEFVCGFLRDGRTLVTVPRSASGNRRMGTPETGPVRLWDIDTGTLRASHFSPKDVFDRVLVNQALDMLCVQQRAPGDGDPHAFHLRLHDAATGAEVARFRCRVPSGNVWWVFTGDGGTTAFDTYDDDRPSVAWHEVRSGRRLLVLPGCRHPIRFSPDGRRFAACRGKEFVVFDAPSGREVVRLMPAGGPNHQTVPMRFSPDGKLLLDSAGSVWDVDAGVRRFGAPKFHYSSSVFTPDGRALAVVDAWRAECWLAYYDTATGE